MRVSSRSSSNTLLLVIGASALALAILILLTGGFRVDAGPIHLSLRRWSRPLGVSAIAWVLLAVRQPATTIAILGAIAPCIERQATAIALVIAAAACGSGIAFGTYAASGSDAGGYVGEAQLLAEGCVHFDEPLARRVSWPNAIHLFAPLGFRASGASGRYVPTYPPGLPLAMVPAIAVFGNVGPFLVSPLLGLIAVLATYAAASAMHSRLAGVVSALLMASSPIALYQVSQPMSDTPVTAWWALAFWCAWQRPHDRGIWRALLAGVAAGAAVLTRPNLLPLAGPIALIIGVTSPRLPSRIVLARLCAFGAALMAFTAVLLAFQWRMYGSALESGYGSGAFASFFAMSNVVPNIGAYARRLLTGEWPSLVLLLVATITIAVRSRADQQRPFVKAIALASVLVGVGVAGYLPYGVFADWNYLRFLLPIFPALFTIVGIATAEAAYRVPRAMAGAGLIVAAAAIVAANVAIARDQLAFAVRASEARYEFAARYVNTALSRTAVVITSQHSVSVHDDSRLPIVRWDLASSLDAIVRDLEALGRRPVILVEEWERPLLLGRFPTSAYARLDWPPRADIGDAVRVYLYDPADRRRDDRYPTDRVH